MTEFRILHNPRCSKSRQALALLTDKGIQPEVIEYLKTPPSVAQLDDICTKLAVEPEAIVRKKEDLFKSLGLAGQDLTRQQWLQTLHEHPKLIERPIVIHGGQARIGRPPENVLELV